MADQDPQEIWQAFYENKKAQRIEEAEGLWQQMENAGVNEETILALDFVHIGNDKEAIDALKEQLSENYNVTISPAENDYLHVKGTTRPEGINLSREQHLAWVEFMADVAQSYACVFSTWSLKAPELNASFLSENIESAT